jgi:hypothetical protein
VPTLAYYSRYSQKAPSYLPPPPQLPSIIHSLQLLVTIFLILSCPILPRSLFNRPSSKSLHNRQTKKRRRVSTVPSSVTPTADLRRIARTNKTLSGGPESHPGAVSRLLWPSPRPQIPTQADVAQPCSVPNFARWCMWLPSAVLPLLPGSRPR